MSTEVFPPLPGLAWSVDKQPEFSTVVRTSASGQETRVALWSAPRWHFKLGYEILRYASAFQELQTLAGFFLARQGQFDSFLYQDPDDNAVVNQQIGTGDGTTTAFQLVRPFGGFVEPILAPNLGAGWSVYVNGSGVGGSDVGIGAWESGNPGVVQFADGYVPASGAAIAATFSYYFPVRFASDLAEFSQFMHQLWELKQLELISVKN